VTTDNPFEFPLDVAAIVLPLAADVIQRAATAAGGTWGLTDVIVQGVAREGDRGQHALDVCWNFSTFFSQGPVAGSPLSGVISRSTLPCAWYTPGALAT
jgi:hypothetical protein